MISPPHSDVKIFYLHVDDCNLQKRVDKTIRQQENKRNAKSGPALFEKKKKYLENIYRRKIYWRI
jgi:hypothetical protein